MIRCSNIQWLLANALASPLGVTWRSNPEGQLDWRYAGPMSDDEARSLASDLRRAEVHAMAVIRDGEWWVEADIDSRDHYPMPRAARDLIASRLLEEMARAVVRSRREGLFD
jgi:hypothetical protein